MSQNNRPTSRKKTVTQGTSGVLRKDARYVPRGYKGEVRPDAPIQTRRGVSPSVGAKKSEQTIQQWKTVPKSKQKTVLLTLTPKARNARDLYTATKAQRNKSK